MSIQNVPTNYQNLIEPRTVRCVTCRADPPYNTSSWLGNTTAVTYANLSGLLGAGSVITNVILSAPSGRTESGVSPNVTYTVGISGPSTTGTVAQFAGLNLYSAGSYLASMSLSKSCWLTVSGTGPSFGGTTYAIPNVTVTYLD